MQDTTAQADDSLTDEPDTEQPAQDQRTVAQRKADRMDMLSPLGQAIEGRPFGHPPRAERPPVWVDQMTRPPLSYSPGNVTELPDYQLHDVAVAEAVTALEAMQGFLTDVCAAREKVKKDPTLTPAAQVLAVAAYADGKLAAATRAVDVAMKAIEQRITDAEAKLREGIPGHATGGVATEVRAFVKGLANSSERMKFLRGLIASGDAESLAAVVKGKPWLSGLSQTEVDLLLHQFNLNAQPDLSPRIDFLKRTRDHLERASAPILLDMYRAIGVKPDTIKTLRDQKAAAKLN